jgi:hemoglobin
MVADGRRSVNRLRVAAEVRRSLDFAKVPAREKGEVLAVFAAHKKEVTAGYKKN